MILLILSLICVGSLGPFMLSLLLSRTGVIFSLKSWWRSIEDRFHSYQIIKVPEFHDSLQPNQLYRRVHTYLCSLPSIEDSDFTNLLTGRKPNDIVLCLDHDQVVPDCFLGARISWTSQGRDFSRAFLLRVRRADKRRILRPYLQHIHAFCDEIDRKGRDLRLFLNLDVDPGRWSPVPFTHPSTFDTVAMESDLKSKVMSDLESFLKAKQYYHRLGRVWKRSFLLYGPSGTGKSSFIAAMANFLSYDIYNLDMSWVRNNTVLRLLLLGTTNKSLIIIEDLDRFFAEKQTAVSLSGMLNFMDGVLTSCCAEERILVFTMNSKDHVDPTVLRPGRIDVHIHFPQCDFSSFKTLASSYLGVKDHKLFQQVEEIFQTGASLSTAEIGELMIANRNSPSRALKSVITALQTDGKPGRWQLDEGSRKSGAESFDSGGVLVKEGTSIKDLRKLYGFLRLKSNRVKSHSLDDVSGQKNG